MAWNYARYLDQVTQAGKAEYPLPVFTNTWIVQPEDNGPGDYPSGGPEPLVIDIWKAGAPSIDINAPDVYRPNFAEWVERFHRDNNPLFIPESRGTRAEPPTPSLPSASTRRSDILRSASIIPGICS